MADLFVAEPLADQRTPSRSVGVKSPSRSRRVCVHLGRAARRRSLRRGPSGPLAPRRREALFAHRLPHLRDGFLIGGLVDLEEDLSGSLADSIGRPTGDSRADGCPLARRRPQGIPGCRAVPGTHLPRPCWPTPRRCRARNVRERPRTARPGPVSTARSTVPARGDCDPSSAHCRAAAASPQANAA